jgi:subtilase family serine protease
MTKRRAVCRFYTAFGLLLIGSASRAGQNPLPAGGQFVGNNTPKFASTGKSLGPENPSTTIDLSIWLNLHNRGELDSLARELYDPNSPNYRNWLDPNEFIARFAPTANEEKTIEQFLKSHNLQVVAVGPANFFVRARGTVASATSAFRVPIEKFEVNGKVYRGNTKDPYVEGPAGTLVSAVYGLDNLEYKHPMMAQASGFGQQSQPGTFQNAASGADSDFFTSYCFTGPKTETYTTGGAFPTATYKGNGYNGTNNIAGCGYIPSDIHTAYHLNGLYKEGFDGTGQTIVIIDWCGSPTITQDANAFSARFGLPSLNSANFKIIPYPTPSTCSAPDAEINIDVEWAHAIAPGARIDLVVPPTATFQDVDTALLFSAINRLGNVISGSYTSEESGTPINILTTENLINQVAAVLGVSANYSSGDSGDYTFDFPQFNPPTVSAPADSPYATAVGGVTLALNRNKTIAFQTGWGNNETQLIQSGTIFDPPLNVGFIGGSGGGPSAFFSKPSYQSSLPGTQRKLPDISWLADPHTGGVIAITEPGVFPPLQYQVWGGTSLSCPMFSALWAIANQEAGSPLGQAAPYLYHMPKGTITDVLPYSSPNNVTATIQESNFLINTYTAAQLAAPLENTTRFYSALVDALLTQDTTFVLTFGTDSGLTTTPGWDNVTGVGTPNGKAFADAFGVWGRLSAGLNK